MSPEQRKEYERQFAEQIKKLFGYEWGNNIDPTTGRQRGGGSMTPTGGGSGGVSGGWLY